MMISNKITKLMIAAALALTVMFSSGVWDDVISTTMTGTAHACISSGSGGGGNC